MGNSEWQARKLAVFARGMGNLHPMYVERARNAEVFDVEGRRYIDFSSGIAVVNTGHSHPDIVAALKRQADAFSHTCIMVAPYASAVELAEKLVAIAPFEDGRVVLVSTGAEAVENAVKIARAATGRPGVIAFGGGFHGRFPQPTSASAPRIRSLRWSRCSGTTSSRIASPRSSSSRCRARAASTRCRTASCAA
jgi:4-aminobutyrate aminotransferase/(S)-3-amino-2-methylpropionate transaminase